MKACRRARCANCPKQAGTNLSISLLTILQRPPVWGQLELPERDDVRKERSTRDGAGQGENMSLRPSREEEKTAIVDMDSIVGKDCRRSRLFGSPRCW